MDLLTKTLRVVLTPAILCDLMTGWNYELLVPDSLTCPAIL